ncbi:MAG TPA: hypothetical protein VMF35_16860 [Acidimicrobiales bacterium]|nr:hypothetical protein [Acidimicrobiales bacterium]
MRTEGPEDPMFDRPAVDLDEWRDEPVPHRYVHGGFDGTNTRFSIYLPPTDSYRGRFFQHITPVPDSENLAQQARGEADKIGFALASGAYFLETNGGGVWGGYGSDDPTIAGYRANAAAARYSHTVASDMYGDHRPYGYVYGGSGGGFRTIGGMENTTGVWDGAVPYVIGSPMAIPNMFTVRMHAQRILRHRLDAIVDAVEPGGGGDPYEGLSEEERDALLEVTRMGFPPRSWFGHRTMGMHAFPVLYGGMRLADPGYFEDFWTQPGYLGYEPPPSLARDRIGYRCEVVAMLTHEEAQAQGLPVGRQPGQARGAVDTAWRDAGDPVPVPVAIRLSSAAPGDVEGADLLVRSGEAEGARVGLLSVRGDVVILGPGDPESVLGIRPGDAVEVDNSGFLAAQTYHRHQVPETDDFPVCDQFREPDGTPMYPQRPLILGPLFAGAAAGTVQNGRFEGKMIVVESLLDREALPWQADWYRGKVKEHLGDALDDHFRLWFTDNALHGDEQAQEDPTHAVSYLGMLQQALRDLSRWVEDGIEPPANTAYEVVDGQVVVPEDAAERRGIQPVVSLTVDGGARVDVRSGEEVTLRARAAVPPSTGLIVAVEWDFDGAGEFPVTEEVVPSAEVAIERGWIAPAPGTYFPVVRVVAQRDGDAATPYARLRNIARVRVVVSRAIP